jgi:hypothetical protein
MKRLTDLDLFFRLSTQGERRFAGCPTTALAQAPLTPIARCSFMSHNLFYAPRWRQVIKLQTPHPTSASAEIRSHKVLVFEWRPDFFRMEET